MFRRLPASGIADRIDFGYLRLPSHAALQWQVGHCTDRGATGRSLHRHAALSDIATVPAFGRVQQGRWSAQAAEIAAHFSCLMCSDAV